jgi:MSHA biogenesis protein MshE|tara:strand:- start:330 stop:2024 length:1695 start_codon:yes stop_codon:yes gene_type:complete
MPLGEVLVQQGLISQLELQQTLKLQKNTNEILGCLLVEVGLITDEVLTSVVGRKLHVPFVNLKTFSFRADLTQLLPEPMARRFHALVLDDKDDILLVALADPLNLIAINELNRLLKRPITLAEAPENEVTLAIAQAYQPTKKINEHAKHVEALANDLKGGIGFAELTAAPGLEGTPVARLLLSLFESSMRMGASDIHIEPLESGLQIRARRDGLLEIQMLADKRSGDALIQRVKLMAGLDISEKRLPLDGSFNVRLNKHTIDVRLSTLPTIYGESVVMRLLSQDAGIRNLDDLGMPDAMLKRFRAVMQRNVGLVLVTGPTGSGKTTTLYAALTEINSEKLKIISVEDPVEYRLPGVTQVQTNEEIDFTFPLALRSILRQDPDVLLVGEIRDTETAEVCFRSAMTGHLVLSTLHTRDAINAPFRLLDMKVEPFIVATSLQAVIAQRLVRLNCVECAEPHVASAQEQSWLSLMLKTGDSMSPQRGQGCVSCSGTGYSGRHGVYEWLEMDSVLVEAASRSDSIAFMNLARERMKGHTLSHHALELVRQGRTSLAEALRVCLDTGGEV